MVLLTLRLTVLSSSTSIRDSVCPLVGRLVGLLVCWLVGHPWVKNPKKIFKITWELIFFVIHITRHSIHYHIHLQLGLIKLIDLIVVWCRAQDRSEEFFLSFHSSSYSFLDCPIELGIGLIELRIGLIELWIGLRNNNFMAHRLGACIQPYFTFEEVLPTKPRHISQEKTRRDKTCNHSWASL